MELQPILYVADMEASTAWWTAVLGCAPEVASPHWTSFAVAGGHLALHLDEGEGDEGVAGRPGGTALSLVVDGVLDDLVARLTRRDTTGGDGAGGGAAGGPGIAPDGPIVDQPFGRSLILVDPDGRRIQVNEHAAG